MQAEVSIGGSHSTRARRFLRHFFAMLLVMMLGMCVLGAWMRYRGHSWERGGEMAAAMSVPVLPLLVLYGFDVIPARGVLGGQMMLMIPAMLAAMLYRKEEYSSPHTAHGHRGSWFAHVH